MPVPGRLPSYGLLMVQHRDEATARAGRQFSKSVDNGASIWRGLEDSRHENVYGRSHSQASGNDVMHAEMYVIRLRRRAVS